MRQLIHAEWTKFRTVRGWVIGMLVAIPLTVLVGLLEPAGSTLNCVGPDGRPCVANTPPVGPDGTAVNDSFYFVHRTLTGDGSITARVGALTDAEPWAKAGVLFKQGTKPGAPYVSVLRTGAHGVRMQHDFTSDVGGPSGVSWVRLSRTGNSVVGEVSSDGARWSRLGSVELSGPVEAGMFVTSPEHVEVQRSFGSIDANGGPTLATATFDDVRLTGGWSADWRGSNLGGLGGPDVGYTADGGRFTVRGTGDIAPIVPSPGTRGKTVENALVGMFAGLIAVLVVATMFVTAEHRRGLIRTSLAASPRRGRLLVAKSTVVGSVSFVVGVVSAALSIPLVGALERAKGMFVFPVATETVVRVVLGTGALFALAAVMAVAVGSLLRRGAGTVTAVIVGIVLPYLLAVASVLPPEPAEWLTRLTPAAAFAVQQTIPEYPQVAASYILADGFFPLSPAGGLAVLCAYAVVLALFAIHVLRRRDV